jgi:anthranilate synthase component 1
MISPDLATVEGLAGQYSIVPICREIYADTFTPITVLRTLSGMGKNYFLLESAEVGEKWGRYSFLGFDPVMRICCKENTVTIESQGQRTSISSQNPLEVLRQIHREYRAPRINSLPPFTGGFVGYFGYAMIAYAEPKLTIKRGSFNDFDLLLCDKVIVYDHFRHKLLVVANVKTDRVKENYAEGVDKIEFLTSLIRKSPSLPPVEKETSVRFTPATSKDEYCHMVKKAKEYIRAGDIFQVVLSRQFTAPFPYSLFNSYRVLRTTNPSPYMVYMNIGGDEIICSSPETLVRLQDGHLTTFPVAGSRPRGKTEAEDKRLERELLTDEKELAEHNMLVDLGRNDLGKISQFSSVRVTGYQSIRRYSTVMHICSQVESDILPQYDAYSAIEAVLPAGTLSGAPKIRACEIIEALEKVPRGIYGGALGYIDLSGNMDTCIAIRMAVKKEDTVYVQAGAGIVADSDPEKEYEESSHKAQAVINAVCRAGEVESL